MSTGSTAPTAPLVSIVLPTRNGAATLPAVLDAIARQRVDFEFEVVAVDSGSHDGTPAILRSRVQQFISISADAFDHGLTRNLGIERARGELIVLLVQDAVPAFDGWLAALTAPLRSDERIAGAFARQRPRPDASAITRYYVERWTAASDVPRTAKISDAIAFDALSPKERFELCIFDNVCSCIRRAIWSRHPFRATVIGEDVEWAKEVLLDGYQIAFVPSAEVVHSHDRSARYELARTYAVHRRLYELFGLRTIPTLPDLVRATLSSIVLHVGLIRQSRNPLGAGRAIALAVAWPLGQYLGARSAIRTWKHARSRRV
jgi:rhamnosyltransferase